MPVQRPAKTPIGIDFSLCDRATNPPARARINGKIKATIALQTKDTPLGAPRSAGSPRDLEQCAHPPPQDGVGVDKSKGLSL